jgi:hypothetical protein
LKKFFVFSFFAIGSCFFATAAKAQFANYFEIHSIAISDVNSQLAELLSENRTEAASNVAIKALGNLNKLSGVTPELNPTTIFEIGFDDALVSQLKAKLSFVDIYSFTALSRSAKNQVVSELEKKYSPYFFSMALQVRKLKLNYATALFKKLAPEKQDTADTFAAELALLDTISDALSVPFLLKNSKNAVVYGFDFLDILNASVLKSSLAAEFSSVTARLTDLYIQTVLRSKNPTLVAVKSSKRSDPILMFLNYKIQVRTRAIISSLQQQEGNKNYVQ